MKNFWSKWFINASSGVFGKVVLVIVLLGGGVAASVYLLPDSSAITEVLVGALPFAIGCLLAYLPRFLDLLKDWSRDASADRIRELELKNENLKLELELQRQKQHSPPDEEE